MIFRAMIVLCNIVMISKAELLFALSKYGVKVILDWEITVVFVRVLFGPCFVMQYLVPFLVLQSSC